MSELLTCLFDTSAFPARWHCGAWTPTQGWLHILSDLGIWSAYMTIPCILVFFAVRRQRVPFKSIFFLFGAFIFACGTAHLMDALVFWWPAYRLAGIMKLVTAIISWATVFALIYIAPKAFALREPEELERESAERKRMAELANAMPQMVWTSGPDGRPERFNDRWYEYTGLTPDVGVAESWQAVLHPEDFPRCAATWQTAIHSGRPYQIECRMKEHKTGAYRWHLGRAVPVKDAAGAIVRWIGTNTDIDDQKRIEEELRRSEEQFTI